MTDLAGDEAAAAVALGVDPADGAGRLLQVALAGDVQQREHHVGRHLHVHSPAAADCKSGGERHTGVPTHSGYSESQQCHMSHQADDAVAHSSWKAAEICIARDDCQLVWQSNLVDEIIKQVDLARW